MLCMPSRFAEIIPASPASTVSIRRPCAFVVPAHVSPSERNPALRLVIVARVLRRSRVERSSLVTISTSPASSWSSALRSWRGRSWLRWLSHGTPSCIRPWSVGGPAPRRSDHRLIAVHTRIS